MEIKEFQEKAVRTLNKNLSNKETLSNMIVGIIGEVGEVADVIKKHLYQGHDLDLDHISEELGDVMFYITNLATTLEIDLNDVIKANYNKLLARYPEGFSAKRSVNRGSHQHEKKLESFKIGEKSLEWVFDDGSVVDVNELGNAVRPQHYRKGEIDLYESWYQTRPFTEFRAIMESVAERYMKRDKTNRVEDLDKAIYTLERLKGYEIKQNDNHGIGGAR